jgi:hypothetical protein
MSVIHWLCWLVGAEGDVARQATVRLRAKPYLALRSVSCSFQDGVLTLRGCLATDALKQIAERIVSRIPSVEAIVDEIEVEPPQAPTPSRLNPCASTRKSG